VSHNSAFDAQERGMTKGRKLTGQQGKSGGKETPDWSVEFHFMHEKPDVGANQGRDKMCSGYDVYPKSASSEERAKALKYR